MKKTINILTLITILCITSLFLASCEKEENGKVTFYVSNAGDANVWDAIRVDMANQSKSFMTPENRNMTLSQCQESPNAATFSLPEGTYTYNADFGSWTGSVTVKNGGCTVIELEY